MDDVYDFERGSLFNEKVANYCKNFTNQIKNKQLSTMLTKMLEIDEA